MQYFVFLIAFALMCFAVIKIPFIKKSALSPIILVGLFITRIAAGITLGWLAHYFSPLNDYTTLNQEGIFEYNHLTHEPGVFFTDIFYSPYSNAYGGYFNAVGSFWNDLRNNIITKILAFLNLISRGDFNTNVLFLNIFPFIGSVAIYRIFRTIFPNRKWILIFGCFLIPTTLLFSSGIHKDLFVYSSLCIYSYGIYFSIVEKLTWKRCMLIIFSFLMILLMRNFLAIALIPATAGFIATQKMSIKPAAIHGSIYIIIMTMLLLNSFFPATMQPLSIITNRQTEFLKLPKAHSQIKLTPLTPNIKSYIKNLPEAIDHGFLQPYFFNTKHWTGTIASTEWFLLFLLPLTFVLVFRREIQIESNFIWFGFMIAFTMFLMIGYIIPNLNSIIRYKSIYLPFIITPILYVASLNKLEKTH